MNYNITTSDYFNVAAKRLAKKYPSFKQDIQKFRDELLKNPLQGDELYPGIRKYEWPLNRKVKANRAEQG